MCGAYAGDIRTCTGKAGSEAPGFTVIVFIGRRVDAAVETGSDSIVGRAVEKRGSCEA